MKNILFLLFSVTFLCVHSQTKRIEKYIQKLDNTQFLIDHSAKASFSVKSPAAKKLIGIGNPATVKLVEALNDPNKTIMAHLVLCHIYFKHVSFAGPKEQTKDGITVYKYFLGEEKGEGLIISEVKKGKDYSLFIEPKNQEDILNYWKTKTKS